MTAPFRSLEVTEPEQRHGGRVDATVFSEALQRRADCTFWFPPVGSGATLPLVVLLHGVFGSHWVWFGRGGAGNVAAELVAGGVTPFALAMPSDGLIGHGSGYVRHRDADVPRWILDEVPLLASLIEPCVDPAAPLGLIGLSMGGYGALRLAAVQGSAKIPAAVGLSSITRLEHLAMFGVHPLPVIADPAERSVVDSVVWSARPIGALRLACGRDDPLFEHNVRLHQDLATRAIEHEWISDEGGHEWPYWRQHLPDSLRFVMRRLGANS